MDTIRGERYLGFIQIFFYPSVLFCTGIRPLLLTGNLKRISITITGTAIFFYLPRSHRNTKLIKKYCATDITGVFEKLCAKLAIETLYRL